MSEEKKEPVATVIITADDAPDGGVYTDAKIQGEFDAKIFHGLFCALGNIAIKNAPTDTAKLQMLAIYRDAFVSLCDKHKGLLFDESGAAGVPDSETKH